MHPAIHTITLLAILSLTIGGITGCGEKRIHVATLSGAQGEELDGTALGDTVPAPDPSGMNESSLDESSLSGQLPGEETSDSGVGTEDPGSSFASGQGPGNFPDELPQDLSTEEPAPPSDIAAETASTSSGINSNSSGQPESAFPGSSGSFSDLSQPFTDHGASDEPNQGTGDRGKETLSTSLADPQDFPAEIQNPSSQGSSSLEDVSGESDSQETSTELPPANLGEGVENVPNTFEVAKAEPSATIEEQLEQMKAEELAAARAGMEDIFFPFDSWSLTEEGKQSLERNAQSLTVIPSSMLLIEGHTDQRGTQAYNMILGKKRAGAIRDYLSELGIEQSRLAIISYGKDKPFCKDPTEVCYQLNRRGHLLIQNP